MTTIIGIEDDKGCILVADSLVTDDAGRKYWHPEMKKLAERGQFLIGGSGEVLPCDIIQHNWEPPTPTSKDRKDLYHFMVSKVVPSLRQCLTENGYNFDESHDKKDGERFHLLIAINGTIFDIDQELSITMNADRIYAVGSGGDIALGALYAGADAHQAMEIAARLSAFTAGPYISKEQFKRS
jgi:ATP-dependent protease HslVU (ClpYQ) peptidase subunit